MKAPQFYFVLALCIVFIIETVFGEVGVEAEEIIQHVMYNTT
jgi:hypothetical protein